MPYQGWRPIAEPADATVPLLALKLRCTLIPEAGVQLLARLFRPLFSRLVVVVVLACLIASDTWLSRSGQVIAVLDLKRPARLIPTAWVTLIVPLLGTELTLVILNGPALVRTYTIEVTRPVRGRYVLIWFTRLPSAGAGRFAAGTFNIVVRGSA